MIDRSTFESGLDRWGGDLARWPDDARRGAEALLTASAPARDLHASMIEVERALASPFSSAVPYALAARVVAVATRRPQERRAQPMLRRAGWGAAVAAALVLGIVAGDVGAGVHEDGPDQVLASALSSPAGSLNVD